LFEVFVIVIRLKSCKSSGSATDRAK